MEQAILELIKNGHGNALINNIGHDVLVHTLFDDSYISEKICVMILNDPKFIKFINLSNDHTAETIYYKIIDNCTIYEIKKFIRSICIDRIEEFCFALIDTYANSDYPLSSEIHKCSIIINSCKYLLMKYKYKYKSDIVLLLATIGIYKKLDRRLIKPDTIYTSFINPLDTLFFNQRSKKIKWIIKRAKHIKEDVDIKNIILVKLLLKFLNRKPNFKENQISAIININPLAQIYQFNNGSICNKLYLIHNLHALILCHRKAAGVLQLISHLPSNYSNNIILLYKLLIASYQIFATKNMTRLILYFM